MTAGLERMEPRGMRKVQKTVMIPEDLYRLISHIEKTTGASFTRLTIAGLLQHLFSDPTGPNPAWMEYTVSLELGEIRVSDLPREREKDNNALALSHAEVVDKEHNIMEIPQDAPGVWASEQWKRMMQADGDDGIAKIIRYWSQWSRSSGRFRTMAQFGVESDTDSGSDAEPGKTD